MWSTIVIATNRCIWSMWSKLPNRKASLVVKSYGNEQFQECQIWLRVQIGRSFLFRLVTVVSMETEYFGFSKNHSKEKSLGAVQEFGMCCRNIVIIDQSLEAESWKWGEEWSMIWECIQFQGARFRYRHGTGSLFARKGLDRTGRRFIKWVPIIVTAELEFFPGDVIATIKTSICQAARFNFLKYQLWKGNDCDGPFSFVFRKLRKQVLSVRSTSLTMCLAASNQKWNQDSLAIMEKNRSSTRRRRACGKYHE